MNELAQQPVPTWFLGVLALGAWASLMVWVLMAVRVWRAVPVLPYQPRRRVPWQGIDLVLVLVVYLATQVGMIFLAGAWLGPELTRPPDSYDVEQANASHLVAKLLVESDVWTLLLCGFSAAVVAPIVEEFLFRVLLQGWLETAQRRWRRAMPTLRRLVPGATGPIVLTSLLFARMHFRVDTPMMHVQFLTFVLVANAVACLLTMAFAIGLLRVRAGATAADLGWVPGKFFADLRLGLLAFLAVAAPLYLAQLALLLRLPKCLAPDPFVLFFLALALGTLYYRTHRIVPAIAAHMALNTTSLVMAWLMMGK